MFWFNPGYHFSSFLGKYLGGDYNIMFVAVNRENDTCFGKELVMGSADCKYYAGLVETPKVVLKVSLALCQTHCKQVPVFSRLSKSVHVQE